MAKIKSIDSSDNKTLELTKQDYNTLKDKFANDETFKLTQLESDDANLASDDKVTKFEMKQGETLKVTAEEFAKLQSKTDQKDTFLISDTTENIKAKLAELIANKDKIKTIDSSDNKPLKLSSEEKKQLDGKFAADDDVSTDDAGVQLKATKDGFSAKVEIEGKKYFVDILSADNAAAGLQAGQKINVSKDGKVTTESGTPIKANVYMVKEFPDGDEIRGVGKTISILKAYTKDGHVFTPIDEENGIYYSQSFANGQYREDGFFERPFGLVEGTTDGVKAERVYKYGPANVYKLTKADGSVTYYVSSKLTNADSTGDITIEGVKPGDTIKFGDGAKTIEKIINEDDVKNGVKQILRDGDDTIVYVGGKYDGYSRSDDLKMVFKNINLENLNSTDGKFEFSQNPLAAGTTKISDAEGFVKLFGNDAPAVKIKDAPNVYKKDGKFYTDASATKELSITSADDANGKVDVEAIKFKDGSVYRYFHDGNGSVSSIKNQTKADITGYTTDSLAKNATAKDTLKIGDTTYTFAGKDNVEIVKNGDFKFENGSSYFGKVSFENAKKITKDAFLKGELNDVKIASNSTVTIGSEQYTINEKWEISYLNTSFEKAKALLSGQLADRVADGAINLTKGSVLTNADLEAVKSKIAKFSSSTIKNLNLTLSEFNALSDAVLSKVGRDAVTLTDDTVFTKDQLKSLIKNEDKIKDGTISKVAKLSAQDFYDIFGEGRHSRDGLSASKIAEKTLKLEDSAANLSTLIYKKINSESDGKAIKSIKTSDKAKFDISAQDFRYVGADKFAIEDNINLTGINSNNKDLILNDKVDTFELDGYYRAFETSVDNLAKFAAKASDSVKFKLVDSSAKILDFLESATDVSKIKEVAFTDDTDVELTAAQANKLADLNIDVRTSGYRKYIMLKDSVENLKADDFKAMKSIQKLNGKIDIKGDDVLELSKAQYDEFKSYFASDDNIKVADVEGSFYAGDANETFVLKQGGKTFGISSFNANDKLDFSQIAPDVNEIGDLNVASNAQKVLENGKLYQATLGRDAYHLDEIQDKLFGEAFAKTGLKGGEKSIVLAKSAYGQTYVFEVSNNDDSTLDANTEVKLLGTISMDRNSNISENNFVLKKAAPKPPAKAQKISDDNGFAKLFDDAPALKVDGVDTIYKKDGKFYTDEDAAQPLGITSSDDETGSVSVKAVKFDDGKIYEFKTPKAAQNKANIKAYTFDGLLANETTAGSLATIDGSTYQFGDDKKVKTIEKDGFKFEAGANNSLTLDKAKKITKEKFLSGDWNDMSLSDNNKITADGASYDIGTFDNKTTIKKLTTTFEKAKEVLNGTLADKLQSNSIYFNEDAPLSNEQLKEVKSSLHDKVAVQGIKSTQPLSVSEFKELLGNINSSAGVQGKFDNNAINISDSAANLSAIFKEFNNNSVVGKIKLFKVNDGNTIEIDGSKFFIRQYILKKLSAEDNVKITNVTNIRAGDAKETFVVKDATNINIGEFATDDKIDFSAIKSGLSVGKLDVGTNTQQDIEDGKIYKTAVSDQFSNNINDLFGTGKAFSKDVAANTKSIVMAQHKNIRDNVTETRIYKIEDKDGNGTLGAGEITLMGSVSGADIGADNIA